MGNILNKKVSAFLLILVFGLILSGCASKTTIKAIKAAKVSDPDLKDIGVLKFKNDSIGQGDIINSKLDGVKIEGNKYFNLIERKNIKDIMLEKELNDSGLVDLLYEDKPLGGLKEVKSLVSGEIILNDLSSSIHHESRTDYSICLRFAKNKKGKKYCAQYRIYDVFCETRGYSLKTNIKLLKVSDSSIIFSETYDKYMKRSKCSDEPGVLPSRKQAASMMAEYIAADFIKDIAPSYNYFSVELLENRDIEYSNIQEDLFKNALELLKEGRVEKANMLLSKLNISLDSKSYVALYDLGVSFEAMGDVKKAYEVYKKAEDIALKNEGALEAISKALIRAKRNLLEYKKAKEQISQ